MHVIIMTIGSAARSIGFGISHMHSLPVALVQGVVSGRRDFAGTPYPCVQDHYWPEVVHRHHH